MPAASSSAPSWPLFNTTKTNTTRTPAFRYDTTKGTDLRAYVLDTTVSSQTVFEMGSIMGPILQQAASIRLFVATAIGREAGLGVRNKVHREMLRRNGTIHAELSQQGYDVEDLRFGPLPPQNYREFLNFSRVVRYQQYAVTWNSEVKTASAAGRLPRIIFPVSRVQEPVAPIGAQNCQLVLCKSDWGHAMEALAHRYIQLIRSRRLKTSDGNAAIWAALQGTIFKPGGHDTDQKFRLFLEEPKSWSGDRNIHARMVPSIAILKKLIVSLDPTIKPSKMGKDPLPVDVWQWFNKDEAYQWYLHHHNADPLWGPAQAESIARAGNDEVQDQQDDGANIHQGDMDVDEMIDRSDRRHGEVANVIPRRRAMDSDDYDDVPSIEIRSKRVGKKRHIIRSDEEEDCLSYM